LIIVGFFELYQLTRMLIQPQDLSVALDNARRIAELETFLRFSWEHSLQLLFLEMPNLVEAMNFYYFIGHFAITGIFFLWLFFRSKEGFYWVRDGFMVASLIALFLYWSFPTAPPRLADMGLEDTLLVFSGIDIGSLTSDAYSNPVAAVPSLHAGWAVAVAYGLILYARRLWVQLLGIAHAAAIWMTIVVTGNHFIFDAIAGAAVMILGFKLMSLWHRLRGRVSGPEAYQVQ
jgi:hypothetical protein